MDRLFAPWRMKYILENGKECGCFLCKTFGENKDKENLILLREKKSFVIMNKYPYNNGHLLVAPIRHVGKLEELASDELLEMQQLLAKAKLAMDKAISPEGYNVGLNLGRTAGAGLEDHIHWHIVPRWNGDTNFMPVLDDTKVLPEYLEETYNKIVDAF